MLQRGSCRMLTGSFDDHPYSLGLTVNDDGSFVAEPLLTRRRKGQEDAFTWKGKIQADLSVAATAPVYGDCSGKEQKAQTTYQGRLSLKKGKYRLNLQGSDTVCSEMGCTFERIFELQQK